MRSKTQKKFILISSVAIMILFAAVQIQSIAVAVEYPVEYRIWTVDVGIIISFFDRIIRYTYVALHLVAENYGTIANLKIDYTSPHTGIVAEKGEWNGDGPLGIAKSNRILSKRDGSFCAGMHLNCWRWYYNILLWQNYKIYLRRSPNIPLNNHCNFHWENHTTSVRCLW